MFDLALHVELARAGARRTSFRLPSVGANRSALGSGLVLEGRLLGNGSAVRRAFRCAASHVPGSQVASNRCGDTIPVGRVQLRRFTHGRFSSSVEYKRCDARDLNENGCASWQCRGAG